MRRGLRRIVAAGVAAIFLVAATGLAADAGKVRVLIESKIGP